MAPLASMSSDYVVVTPHVSTNYGPAPAPARRVVVEEHEDVMASILSIPPGR